MIITTKFDLGQIVYPISQRQTKEIIPCLACGGKGIITLLDNTNCVCPRCYGDGGKSKWLCLEWYQDKCGVIGSIKVSIYDDNPNNEDEYRYMLDITGIGSGTLWPEDRLFSTYDDALFECDRRNRELES
jgi:hypothetical protein